jgi:hypothetical protein
MILQIVALVIAFLAALLAMWCASRGNYVLAFVNIALCFVNLWIFGQLLRLAQ